MYAVMQKPLLLLFLAGVILAENRIVGGRAADISEYPYQASVRLYSHHICGAAILNQTVLVTAAHCVQHSGAYSIKAGVNKLDDPGQTIHVNLALVHPNYDTRYHDYDIALLFLAKPLKFDKKVHFVALPDSGSRDQIRPRMIGKVTGWGVTAHDSKKDHENELKVVELPVWNFESCRNVYYDRLTVRMFCAGLPQGGKDACQGDSGGPFVVGKLLYGVVSSGVDCAQPGLPGLYTNLQILRGFIREYAGF